MNNKILVDSINNVLNLGNQTKVKLNDENWIQLNYKISHLPITFSEYKKKYLLLLEEFNLKLNKKRETKNGSKKGVITFNAEYKLKNLRNSLPLNIRQSIYDFAFTHFQSGDVKTISDFDKIKDLFIEKFRKHTIDEKAFKRIFVIAYKAYKQYLQQISRPQYFSDNVLKDMEKTLKLSKSKKGRIKDPMHFTLDNIRSIQRTKLLTKEQERMYAKMALEGRTVEERERGRERLINANLRLVISIAKRYNNKGIELPDLIDEGLVGLNKAIDKFDYRKGFKFATYSTWWIRQAITRIISDQGRAVRIPVHLIEQIGKASKEERNLALRAGKHPKQHELEQRVYSKYKINLPKLSKLKKTSSEPILFDRVIGEHNDSKFGDFLADETIQRPDEQVAESIQRALIEEMFNTILTNDEREVIKRYFGFSEYTNKRSNLTDIARRLEKKPEVVKSLFNSAIEKLKDSKLGISLGLNSNERNK